MSSNTIHFHPAERYDYLGKLRGLWNEYKAGNGQDPEYICVSPKDYEDYSKLQKKEQPTFRGITLKKGEHE